jgi:hypothetical protein
MFLEFTENGGLGNVDTPSKEKLIAMLRDKKLWPANFGPWDFHFCESCAMGLASARWGIRPNSDVLSTALGIDCNFAYDVFVRGKAGTGPNSIALALEQGSTRGLFFRWFMGTLLEW